MKRFVSFAELIDLFRSKKVVASKWGKFLGEDSKTNFLQKSPSIFAFGDDHPYHYTSYFQLNFDDSMRTLGSGFATYHFYDAWETNITRTYTHETYKEFYLDSYNLASVESVYLPEKWQIQSLLEEYCYILYYEDDGSIRPESIYVKEQHESWQWLEKLHAEREEIAILYNHLIKSDDYILDLISLNNAFNSLAI